MSTEQITAAASGNGRLPDPVANDDGIAIDLPLSVRRHWCVLDLDELVEAIAAAGLPREVLVVHRSYAPYGGHRVMHRRASRKTAA